MLDLSTANTGHERVSRPAESHPASPCLPHVREGGLAHSLKLLFEQRAAALGHPSFSHYACIDGHGPPEGTHLRVCNADELPAGCCESRIDPPGASVPVVHDRRIGFCESHALRGRECSYMVVLREPHARLVSAYNYFCVFLHEGRDHDFTESCPNATLYDFAHRWQRGYSYTATLGGRRRGWHDAAEREGLLADARAMLRDARAFTLDALDAADFSRLLSASFATRPARGRPRCTWTRAPTASSSLYPGQPNRSVRTCRALAAAQLHDPHQQKRIEAELATDLALYAQAEEQQRAALAS